MHVEVNQSIFHRDEFCMLVMGICRRSISDTCSSPTTKIGFEFENSFDV